MCIHLDYLVIENVAGIHQCEDECMVRQPECKGIVRMLKTCVFEALDRAIVHVAWSMLDPYNMDHIGSIKICFAFKLSI